MTQSTRNVVFYGLKDTLAHNRETVDISSKSELESKFLQTGLEVLVVEASKGTLTHVSLLKFDVKSRWKGICQVSIHGTSITVSSCNRTRIFQAWMQKEL